MGAVHDLGSLVVSLRNDGKSISEIAARYINNRVRMIFFIIVYFALLIIIAIFGLVIATVFKIYPESVIAVWLEVPIAIGLGWAIYKRSANVKLATLVAVALMYVGVILGAINKHYDYFPTAFPETWAIQPAGLWTLILLAYAFIASTLPVTNAAAAAGLYECLAAVYHDGAAGRRCRRIGVVWRRRFCNHGSGGSTTSPLRRMCRR